MATPLHNVFTASSRDLLTDLTQRRSTLTIDETQCPITPLVSEEELSSRIGAFFTQIQALFGPESGAKLKPDNLKGHLEVTGREIILGVAEEELSLDTSDGGAKWLLVAKLYDACDIIRILYTIASTLPLPDDEPSTSSAATTPKWDPIVMFMAIIDELVELLSIDSWNIFLGYFESRREALTQGKLLTGVRALYFLKPLNSLLRSTSRSSHAHPSTTFASFEEYLESTATTQSPGASSISGSTSELEFRGRIHLLMSGLFRLSDPSATNSRGDYADMLSEYGEVTDLPSNLAGGDSVAEEEKTEMDVSDNSEGTGKPSELFDTLSTLQRFFSNPAGITAPATAEKSETGLQEFRRITETFLPALATSEVRSQSDSSIAAELFIPRYIPSRDTVKFQLGELEFRRQLCIQLLVILQQIQNLHVKDKARHPKDLHFPATFTVETDDFEWARKQTAVVHSEIIKMPGGREFDNLISSILARERNHAIWKHAGCYAFERPSMSDEEIAKAEDRRKAIIAPLPPFTHAAGTKALSQLSRNPVTTVEQLKKHKITETVKSLQEKWNDVDFDEGMSGNQREFLEQKASLSWRALRLVQEEDFDILEKLKDKYDPNEIIRVKQEMTKSSAETSEPVASTTGTPNPPPAATFAADSETDDKDKKPVVEESILALDVDVKMDPVSHPDALEKPAMGESAGHQQMDSTNIAAAAPATPAEISQDVDMQ